MEFAAKDSAEHLDGKKEVVAWFDPARVIDRQSTGRHHAMYMRVKFEFLTPTVQHAEEADFRTEMLGIARDFQKGFRTGAKQEIVDDLLVLQDQRSQMTRKREDHMDVARREKFLATRCEPAIASSCLTLWAVPISARVVGDGAMSAASAFIEMPAERGGTTPRDSLEHYDKTPATAELIVWDRTYKVQPDADIVINATSIGLYPHVDGRLDIDIQSLRHGMVVADVVPSPPRTNLITDAEARGCKIVDGLGMLVNQGVISLKYWTGIDVNATIMRRKLEDIYGV